MEKAQERKSIQTDRMQRKLLHTDSQIVQRTRFESDDMLSNMAGKVAVVSGGDNGIAKQMAISFARAGANIVIAYLDKHNDAEETRRKIEEEGRQCLIIPGDVSDETHCAHIIDTAVAEFGGFDILIDDAAIHYPNESLEDIMSDNLDKTFRTDLLISLARKLL